MVGQAVYNDLMQKQTAAENFIEQCEKLGKPLRFTSDTCDSVNVFSKFNRTGRTTLTHVAELLEPFELYGAIQLDWRVTLADEACYCFVCAGVKTECGGCRVLFLFWGVFTLPKMVFLILFGKKLAKQAIAFCQIWEIVILGRIDDTLSTV